MDPLTATIIAGTFAWNMVSPILESAGGGVIEGGSDKLFCGAIKQISDKLKLGTPQENHHLARAFRRSCLRATLQICKSRDAVLGKRQGSFMAQVEGAWLKQADEYLKAKIKELDNNAFVLEQTSEKYQTLLVPSGVSAQERAETFRQDFTGDAIEEMRQAMSEPPPEPFVALMRNSWFGLVCNDFQDALSANQYLANRFQNNSLVEISFGVSTMTFMLQEVLQLMRGKPAIGEATPLLHSLPTNLEIEGREAECAIILRAMQEGKAQVLAFAAPGGFGKTALLAKLLQKLSADEKTFLEQVSVQDGASVKPCVGALLHVDCRSDVKVSALFENAGKLIGQQQAFQDLYNAADRPLAEKGQMMFNALSANVEGRVWLVFDNFEPLLDEKGAVASAELREFFSQLFAGGHHLHALIAARDVPKFSPREKVFELEDIGRNLFDGLPIGDSLAYLKKNDAAKGLQGSDAEVDAVLESFSNRVHRIPLALVWAVGYLRDTGFTLKEVLEKDELFADFDKEQAKDADRYENKGLKRLHYEQLRIQPDESLLVLRLLAFFKRAVPKGALVHLLDEIELNKTLTRLEHNKLITRKESSDGYTRFLNDPLAVNLYALHPIICENEFFDALPNKASFYEQSAEECWQRAYAAYEKNRFAYAVELFDCAEKLYEYLIQNLNRTDWCDNYATMLMNKGETLRRLNKLNEAIGECDKAVDIYECLVKEEKQEHLANKLAIAYLNKNVVLTDLQRLNEAIEGYNKAIAILERLVNQEGQMHLADNLALAYMNKGIALFTLTRPSEAIYEYGKATVIFERLVNQEEQTHLADRLAATYLNKGNALINLTRFSEAIDEYNKAIVIRECLVNQEGQMHLADSLALAYMNKGIALDNLIRLSESIVEFERAIDIYESLVNQERQMHLAFDLARAYLNKGATLNRLTRPNEAIFEYDKAIAILEQLVNQERQMHLAHLLATTYANKAFALEDQENWDASLACYDDALQIWALCIEQLGMFWLLPSTLLRCLRNRLEMLIDLERWQAAAQDVLQALNLVIPYMESEEIHDELKQAAEQQFAQMLGSIHALTAEQRELLYAELGDAAARVREWIEAERE